MCHCSDCRSSLSSKFTHGVPRHLLQCVAIPIVRRSIPFPPQSCRPLIRRCVVVLSRFLWTNNVSSPSGKSSNGATLVAPHQSGSQVVLTLPFFSGVPCTTKLHPFCKPPPSPKYLAQGFATLSFNHSKPRASKASSNADSLGYSTFTGISILLSAGLGANISGVSGVCQLP